MNGKESLEKYHCTVPCRMCEYNEQERREMPCLVCVVRPNFTKDILRNEYRKFTPMLDKPTADVVEVVRCKDCKHCEHFYPECDKNGNYREAHFCKSIKSDVKPDDYCCWGERRCEE